MIFLNFTQRAALSALLCSAFALNVSGQSNQIINPNGGASSRLDDGLKVIVRPEGNLFVFRENRTQFCCGANYDPNMNSGAGVALNFRFEQNNVFSNSDISMTSCSTTPALQNGYEWTTSITGYVTSPFSNLNFFVTMDLTYRYPQNYFFVDYYVRAPSDANYTVPETLHLYLDHDAYILGSDGSKGCMSKNVTGHFVGNYRDNEYCASHNDPRRYATHGFKAADEFRSYYSGLWNKRNDKDGQGMLGNVIEGSVCEDDGIAVEFTIGPVPRGEVRVKRIMHAYGDSRGDFDLTPVVDPMPPVGISSPVSVDFVSSAFFEPEENAEHTAKNIRIVVGGGRLVQEQICNFSVADVSAKEGTDYNFVKGFKIPPGDYSVPVVFTLNSFKILGNTQCQSNRTFNITIDRDACNDLVRHGNVSQTLVTIVDDDLSVDQPNDGYFCSGVALDDKMWVFGGKSPGAVYEWSASNAAAVGLPVASGTGKLPAFTTANSTDSVIVSTVTVTPKTANCTGNAKTFTISVEPVPSLNLPDLNVCLGAVVPEIKFDAPGTVVRNAEWRVNHNAGTLIGMPADSGAGNIPSFVALRPGSVTVTFVIKSATGCTSPPKSFTLSVNQAFSAGTIHAGVETVCHGIARINGIANTVTASGGDGAIVYRWKLSNPSTTTVINSNTADYSPTMADLGNGTPGDYVFVREARDGSCSGGFVASAGSRTLSMLSASLLNYSDIRISVCPDTLSSPVNLSKYIDTTRVNSLIWHDYTNRLSVSKNGMLDTKGLTSGNVFSLNYAISNPCVTLNRRKLYIHTIKDSGFRRPIDTIAVCHRYAEALQISRMFGIEAGGTFGYDTTFNPVVSRYVKRSVGGRFDGALTFNGKDAYLVPGLLPTVRYRGATERFMKFTYKPAKGSCLSGKEYELVIVLTQNMLN